jgi:uncharacterized protein
MTWLPWITRLPGLAVIAIVRLYQLTLSPFIGRQCRFAPTCSNYMIQAIEKYGALRGVPKGVWRIIRCNPFCRGGIDEP